MIIVLDVDSKTFMLSIVALTVPTIMPIFHFRIVPVASLISMEIFAKYSNFLDIFFSDSIAELPKHIKMNNNSIDLLKEKQPPYGLIYSL